MAVIEVGKEYKLSRHPSTPIGKVTAHNTVTQEVTVEWNDVGLIPPVQKYSDWEFLANFEPAIGGMYYGLEAGGNKDCVHSWREYVGFKEDYEFCVKCDRKRFKQ